MLKVLLVCTGNICRSPIAHGLLVDRSERSLDGSIAVRSAGTWARGGSPATAEAVAAASELGVDIDAHRCTRFEPELAGWADLILTMTEDQHREVLETAPDAAARTFTLKELVALLDALPPTDASGRKAMLARIVQAHALRAEGRAPELADPDVADPLGLSQLTYRAIAHEIESLIDALIAGLAGQPDVLAREA